MPFKAFKKRRPAEQKRRNREDHLQKRNEREALHSGIGAVDVRKDRREKAHFRARLEDAPERELPGDERARAAEPEKRGSHRRRALAQHSRVNDAEGRVALDKVGIRHDPSNKIGARHIDESGEKRCKNNRLGHILFGRLHGVHIGAGRLEPEKRPEHHRKARAERTPEGNILGEPVFHVDRRVKPEGPDRNEDNERQQKRPDDGRGEDADEARTAEAERGRHPQERHAAEAGGEGRPLIVEGGKAVLHAGKRNRHVAHDKRNAIGVRDEKGARAAEGVFREAAHAALFLR